MRKIVFAFVAVATVAAFCACASVDVAPASSLNNQNIGYKGKTVAHLHANIWGLYLFDIPLLTASVDNPGSIEILKDTVTVGNAAKLLTAKSNELGAKETYNLVTTHATMPFLIGFREVSMSANALR